MDGRRDSKKNRNSTKGGRHQSEAENEISDGENLNQSQTDADLVNDFRNTLHTLNTQFTDLENQDRDFIFRTITLSPKSVTQRIQPLKWLISLHPSISQCLTVSIWDEIMKSPIQYRRVVRENHDLRRQITKLEARVKISRKNSKKSKTSFF